MSAREGRSEIRAHYRNVVQDTAGNITPGAVIAVYTPGTTTPIPGQLFADGSSSATLANPYVSPDGVVSFYLGAAQRVDLGITPPGGGQVIFNDIDVGSEDIAGVSSSWLVTVPTKSSAYTPGPGEFVPVDATAGSVTVTLPAFPQDQSIVGVKMTATASSHTVTVSSGSASFNAGGGTTLTLSLLNQGAVFQYSAALNVWYIEADDLPLSQLDARYAPAGTGGVALAGDLGGSLSVPTVISTHLSAPLPVNQGGTASTSRVWAGLLTPTAIKTGAYSAAAGQFVPVDVSGGSVTITLPAAPADLTTVGVKLVKAGSSNTVTVSCGGSDHFNDDLSTSLSLKLLNQGLLLQYSASPAVWYVLADDLPLGQLDSRYTLAGATAGQTVNGFVQESMQWSGSMSAFPGVTGVLHLVSAAGGNVTVQLAPTASVPAGGALIVKRVDASGNTLTVLPASGEKVNGRTAGVPLATGQARWFMPNAPTGAAAGTGWMSFT